MNILENVPQGSAAWLAIRTQYNTASEAPAALGASKYLSRSDLLKQKSTGLTPEVGGAKQALFDRGHQSEASARSLAEAIIGTELFPVTATFSVDGIDLLASMDGATMDETIIWEHKLFSEKLANDVRAGMLDPHYTIQLDQQLLVSGAKKCLFMTSDGTEANMAWCWYEYDQAKADALLAGWRQFRADLATYVPPVVIAEAVGHTPETLPALRIEVTGMVTASNLADYKAHALAVFGGINRDLTTDQQFADAEKVVKWCGDVEDRLAAAKQHALSQTASIDELFRAIDDISAEARRTRLELDKLVKSRKELVRGEIVAEGVAGLRAHVDGLNARLGKAYMPVITADFGGAIKGKRTVESIRGAVNDLLATHKIAANATADKIDANLKTLRELAAAHAFLFADAAQIVQKAPDDLTMLVKTRIAEHQAAEAAQLEAQRAKIRAEEETKARAEAEVKLRAEQAAERAALQAKEQQAQAEIAAAQKAGALAAPLAADLSGLVQEQRAQAVDLRDTKILIPEIPGEWTQRTRSGNTNIWNDPWHNKTGLPTVRMEPPQKGLHAERIDGAWYWVCGCELCLGSGKSYSYVTCEEHDRCVTCKCTRDQLTETPWGASGGGWRCKPCQDKLDAIRKADALAAAEAKGHSEDDCCYLDKIICPHCATEQSSDDRNESTTGLECDTCGGGFDLEVEWSPTYTTTKLKQ